MLCFCSISLFVIEWQPTHHPIENRVVLVPYAMHTQKAYKLNVKLFRISQNY